MTQLQCYVADGVVSLVTIRILAWSRRRRLAANPIDRFEKLDGLTSYMAFLSTRLSPGPAGKCHVIVVPR
jgi:hypothetical protein